MWRLQPAPSVTRREGIFKMDPLNLQEIASMAGVKLLNDNPNTLLTTISKDTRTLKVGDLYVGLRGENFDGNLFAEDAIKKGAAALLLDSPEIASNISKTQPVLLAEDSLKALTNLAREWRARLNIQTIGITGSCGKTSTKDFTAAVMGTRFKTVKTAGNFNNHIGVPLSILSATSKDEAAVWEIGMNHPGEIAPLADLIQPHCAIITNIGVAHIEYMGSREAIALEKGMLAEAVPPRGSVILNHDDDQTESIASRCLAKVIRTGLSGGDLTATDVQSDIKGTSFTIHYHGNKYTAHIPVPGIHMVQNALLALTAGLEFGIPLETGIKGLEKVKIAAGRLEKKTIKGVTYLDDSYNANPDSMEAALKTLRNMVSTGHRIAVLGKMGELGEHATEGYERTGKAAAKWADILITVGPEASQIAESARSAGMTRIHETGDTSSAVRMLGQLAKEKDIVLIKGSRSAQMEKIIQYLNK